MLAGGKLFGTLSNKSASRKLFLNEELVNPGEWRFLRRNDQIGIFESSLTVFHFYDNTDNDHAEHTEALKKKYILLKTLGTGAFAKTVLAFLRDKKEARAIKIIKKDDIVNSKMLKNEIETLKASAHEYIIKLHDVIETTRYLYLVMELGDTKIPQEQTEEEVGAR